MRYFTSTHGIAEALRTLADTLGDLPDVPLAEVRVSVDMQVTPTRNTEADRIGAVDTLAFIMLDTDAEARHCHNSTHYGTPFGRDVAGIEVDAYTADLSTVTAVAA